MSPRVDTSKRIHFTACGALPWSDPSNRGAPVEAYTVRVHAMARARWRGVESGIGVGAGAGAGADAGADAGAGETQSMLALAHSPTGSGFSV